MKLRHRARRARVRLAKPLLLATLTAVTVTPPTYGADQDEEQTKATESFVVLTISPRTAAEQERVIGSGVLVDDEGHILTACHVVKDALDEGWRTGPLAMQPGASVVAQFVDSAGMCRPETYAVDVLACTEDPDVAVVQLRDRPPNLATRSLPVIDPDGAYESCHDCLGVLGYPGPYPGHFEVQSGNGVTVNGYVGQFTADDWYGFSGGPVFYKGDGGQDEWQLAGIATSGDSARATTKYLVTYWGTDSLCGGFRERLAFSAHRGKAKCPSERFQRWAGSSVSLDGASLATFVNARTQTPDQGRELASRLLSEDCRENALWAATLAELVAAKLALAAPKQPALLSVYSDLVDKLVSIYHLLTRKSSEDVKRGREIASVQFAACQHQQIGRTTCLVRAVRSQERLWNWAVNDGYLLALSQKQDQAFWTITYVESLKEWGDVLYQLAFSSETEAARTDARLGASILYVDSQWRPERAEREKVAGLELGAAALDKYATAYSALFPKKQSTRGNDWDERREKLCREVRRLSVRLRDLAKGDAPQFFTKLTKIDRNQFKNCAL